jgi:hypothetical protein
MEKTIMRFPRTILLGTLILGGLALTLSADPAAPAVPPVPPVPPVLAAVAPVGSPVKIGIKRQTQSIPAPATAKKDAIPAEVEIIYPELSGPDELKTGLSLVQSSIQKRLLGMLASHTPETIDALIGAFGKEYETAVGGGAELTGGWLLKFTAEVKYASGDLLALEILETVSIGGAHGDSRLTNQVFSLKTGELLTLKAVVPEAKQAELLTVAEKTFRQAQQVKPEETLAQAGFQFEKDSFALNENFLVSEAGVSFCWNHFEIAPYAKGLIQITIPWAELKGIVAADGPAAPFLAAVK